MWVKCNRWLIEVFNWMVNTWGMMAVHSNIHCIMQSRAVTASFKPIWNDLLILCMNHLNLCGFLLGSRLQWRNPHVVDEKWSKFRSCQRTWSYTIVMWKVVWNEMIWKWLINFFFFRISGMKPLIVVSYGKLVHQNNETFYQIIRAWS